MEFSETIQNTVTQITNPQKGIFAVDESQKTMLSRLQLAGITNGSEADSDALREMLFDTEGLEAYISGAILHESSLVRRTQNGGILAELLRAKNIVLGVKVDNGLAPLMPHQENSIQQEQISRGLDTLSERLPTFFAQGIRFTKWRSVFLITDELPTQTCTQANAHVLAQYASVVQHANMVPIIEPEILYDGTHTLQRSKDVHREVLRKLFATIEAYGVHMEALILKTSMVLPGKESNITHSGKEIAEATLSVLEDTIPENIAGVVFLSGGQTPSQATENLHALRRAHNTRWPITFSYSRATEEEAIATWAGKEANIQTARNVLLQRLQALTTPA